MREIWQCIKSYNKKYQISNLGRVKNRKKILKICNNGKGYLYISLSKNNKRKNFLIHRLVANAFIINKENKPCINHIDGNKQNNKVDNLEWITYSENHKHAFKIGLKKSRKGEEMSNSKLKNKDVLFIKKNKNNYSRAELGRKFKICPSTISRIILGHRWRHINEN